MELGPKPFVKDQRFIMIGDSGVSKLDDHTEKFGTHLLSRMDMSSEERETTID